MTKTPRWLCAVLVVALAFTGPLGSLSLATPAAAQTSPVVYSGDQPPSDVEPSDGDRIGAGFMNVLYVPGKAIVCTAGTVASVGLLLLTFGFGYHAARNVWMEGCSGDWLLTGEHLSGKVPLRPEIDSGN